MTACNAYRDRLSLTSDNLSPDQTVGGLHSNGTDSVLSHMVRNLQNESDVLVLYFQSSCDVRQLSFELHIDNSSNDLKKDEDCIEQVVDNSSFDDGGVNGDALL